MTEPESADRISLPSQRENEAPRATLPGTRWLAVLLGMLLLAGGWWWSTRRPATAVRQSLAVLSFSEPAPRPDSAWLSTALSEMLTTQLAASSELRVIPAETIARMRRELKLGDDEPPGQDALSRLGDTDFVVHGSYRVVPSGADPQLHLEVRLRSMRGGETLAPIEQTGTEARLFELVSDVAAELRSALGLKKLSSAQQRSLRATLPSNPAALRLYLDGREKLRHFDALAARESLAEAIAIDPSYALAHTALSDTWSALGYDRKAQVNAARAYELATGLPAESYLHIEGRYFETAAEWPRAVQTYRELWRRRPDNVDYGLHLAEAQVMSGRGQDALETINRLRAQPTLTSRDDPRIDLAEAAAASSLASYGLQKAAAQQAVEKGQALGASILVANARRWQGRAHYETNELEQARIALEESRWLFEEAGDRRSAAEVLSLLANLRYSQGDSTAAVDLFHKALAIHQETGNRQAVAETENSLGFQLYLRGDLAAARAMLEEAVAIARETGERYREANYLDSLIDVLLSEGDLEAAEELAQQERAIYRELGNRLGLFWSYYHLGRIALTAGDVPRARRFHDRALVICEELDDPYWTALILDALARDLLAAGDLAGARRMSEDSSSIRQRLGEKETLAGSQMTQAEVLLELGRASDAEALARMAGDVYGERARPDDEIAAVVVIARTLLAQGRLVEAGRALADARARVRASQNPTVRFSVAMAEAELLAANRNRRQAMGILEKVVDEAHRLGLIKLELEARLAWGEIEIGAGLQAGRQRLEALAKKADELGHGLIAGKANAALAISGSRIEPPASIRIRDA